MQKTIFSTASRSVRIAGREAVLTMPPRSIDHPDTLVRIDLAGHVDMMKLPENEQIRLMTALLALLSESGAPRSVVRLTPTVRGADLAPVWYFVGDPAK